MSGPKKNDFRRISLQNYSNEYFSFHDRRNVKNKWASDFDRLNYENLIIKSSNSGVSFTVMGQTSSSLVADRYRKHNAIDIIQHGVDYELYVCATAQLTTKMYICNRSNGMAFVDIALIDSPDITNISEEDYIFTNFALQPYETKIVEGFSVAVNDSIAINSTTSDLNVIIYGKNKIV